METDRRWDDEPEEPRGEPPDFAWGRTANPNSADGELQNIAAFGAGLSRLSGGRRRAAAFVVWLILIGFALTVLLGIFGIAGVI
ncbi:MAG TPA: hypothetical protein VH373_18760 [Jatrophihabitantaceae bacterium]|jgi:hypothetical protein